MSTVRPALRVLQQAIIRYGRFPVSRGHATAVGNPAAEGTNVDVSRTVSRSTLRRYTKEEVSDIYNSPLLGLVHRAAGVHAVNQDPTKVQLCTLLNIKSRLLPKAYPIHS